MTSLHVNPERMRRYIARTQPRRRSHSAIGARSTFVTLTTYEDWSRAMRWTKSLHPEAKP